MTRISSRRAIVIIATVPYEWVRVGGSKCQVGDMHNCIDMDKDCEVRGCSVSVQFRFQPEHMS